MTGKEVKLMHKKNPYALLGISQGANKEEIKKAYRNMARQYHPDANSEDQDAEERFKEIKQAYEYLLAHSDGNETRDGDFKTDGNIPKSAFMNVKDMYQPFGAKDHRFMCQFMRQNVFGNMDIEAEMKAAEKFSDILWDDESD